MRKENFSNFMITSGEVDDRKPLEEQEALVQYPI